MCEHRVSFPLIDVCLRVSSEESNQVLIAGGMGLSMKKTLLSFILATMLCMLIGACAETLSLPEDLRVIGDEAFANVKVDFVVFPNDLTSIADSAFQGASFIGTGEPGIYAQHWCEIHGFEYRPYETDPQWFEWTRLKDDSLKITKYTGTDKRVFVPASIDGLPVSELGTAAFMTNKTLEVVTIPESVKTIGGSAFERCSNLKEVRLSEGLDKIMGFAFSACPALTEIDLPDSITTIEGGAFGKSTALTTVRLPAGLTSTPRGYSTNGPFNGSETITKVIFPASMTVLPDCVCWGMSALTDIVWPTMPTKIGDGAFAYCEALKKVMVPNGVTTLGYYAFKGCTSMTSITFPSGITSVGGECFRDCEALTRLDLPDSVHFIGGGAFRNCVSLSYFHYPEGYYETNNYGDTGLSVSKCNTIFYGCTSLKRITVPEGVVKIPARTFMNATALEQVTFPSSLQELDTWAFRACPSIKTLYVPSNVLRFGEGVFVDNTELVVQCVKPSLVYTYCVENNVPYEIVTGN